MPQLTRRQAIQTAAFAALAAASAGLTACSAGDDEWDGSAYLPLGTVVKLKSYESNDIKHVVITRRPRASSALQVEGAGEATACDILKIWDYALLPWPVGIYSDFANSKNVPCVIFTDAEEISEVLFMGYSNDTEKSAEEALAKAREAGTTGPDALSSLIDDTAAKIKEIR